MATASNAVRWDSMRSRVIEGWHGADIGLLVLRLVLGVIFLGHGLQKLGWFEGGGYASSIDSQKLFLSFFGYSSTTFLAWVLTFTEVGAGLSLLFGVATPLGVAAAIGIMFQFFAGTQWDGGLFGNETQGGFEFTLSMAAAAAVLAFVGPGQFSIDHAIGWKLDGLRGGVAAVALAVVVGGFVLIVWGVGLGGQPPIPGG